MDRDKKKRYKVRLNIKRNDKKVFGAVIVLSILIGIISIYSQKMIYFKYHYRFLTNKSMHEEIKNDQLHLKLSLKDLEYYNTLPDRILKNSHNGRKINVNMNGKDYDAELFPYNHYATDGRLNNSIPFSIEIKNGESMNQIKGYDIFQTPKIEYYEQELIYQLARQLQLLVPQTTTVQLLINDVHHGNYLLKQAYDSIFLEENNLSGSVIFRIEIKDAENMQVEYLYNDSVNDEINRHIYKFIELLKARDKNLLLKYFDLDYIGSFEVLREVLGAKLSFVIDENITYLYNPHNGKIYPILDEANISNFLLSKKNRFFKDIEKQMTNNQLIKHLKSKYMGQLLQEYDNILIRFREITDKYYKKEDYSLERNKEIISQYYHRQMHQLLEQKPVEDAYKAIENPDMNMYKSNDTERYLENKVFYHSEFERNNKNLKFSIEGNRIILKRGSYIVDRNMYIPLGNRFEIEAGTMIKIAPNVSIISYSPINILGTAEQPVYIKALEENKPFGVIAVMGTSIEKSTIKHLDISGGSKAFLDGVDYQSTLNFYNTALDMRYCEIHHNFSDAALHVTNSDILIENTYFYANKKTQVHMNGCQGLIQNNDFIGQKSTSKTTGIEAMHSNVLIRNNYFENFTNKAMGIHKDAKGILVKNQMINNHRGIWIRDAADVIFLENQFQHHQKAVDMKAQRNKDQWSNIYILDNEFDNNTEIYGMDNFVNLYEIGQHKEFERLLDIQDKDEIKKVFEIFEEMEAMYPRNQLEGFKVGNKEALIDEENKFIFVKLPAGASTVQSIDYKFALENTETFMKPLLNGINVYTYEEEKINKDSLYDFKSYIFKGEFIYKTGDLYDKYDLYITSGDVAVMEIQTIDEDGMFREIDQKNKGPCEMRMLSQNQNKSVNRTVKGKIEKSSSKEQEKPHYRFNLNAVSPLAGMNRSKKWLLEDLYGDPSFMRVKLALDLYKQFPQAGAAKSLVPNSQLIELIVNNQYQGIYLLTEHIDEELLDLEGYEPTKRNNAAMYLGKNLNANYSDRNHYTTYYTEDYQHFPSKRQPTYKYQDPIWSWHSGFEQIWPRVKRFGEQWKELNEFLKFVALATEEDFEKRFLTSWTSINSLIYGSLWN